MKRHGQAAVEFLTTYSWALFLLFGVGSAIFMLDLGDPDRYADPECVTDQQINCLEASYTQNTGASNDSFRLNLRNNYPRAIEIGQVDVTLADSDITYEGDNLNGSSNYTITPGQTQIILVGDDLGWTTNGYVTDTVLTRAQLRIEFSPTSSANVYNKTGYTVFRAVDNT
jgi:hypothetical protein